jgi:DNA-binding response OmpR family regulator
VSDRPVRVLLVEDEMLVAFLIEGYLREFGCEIVGPVSRVAKALRMVEAETFDLALLDINLAGEEVYPVASQLKARGVPFVLLSGYGPDRLRDEWIGSPILSKPIQSEALKASIETLMQGAAKLRGSLANDV